MSVVHSFLSMDYTLAVELAWRLDLVLPNNMLQYSLMAICTLYVNI